MKYFNLLGRACLLGALALSSFAALAAPRETLHSVLAKHARASADPSALSDRAPLKTVYAISAGGLSGTLVEYNLPPKKNRVEMTLGPIKETMVDNGLLSWQQDATGNVRVLRGAELTENRADSGFSLETYDPLKSRVKAAIVLRPKRDPKTGDYIIDVRPKGGNLQTIYISPKTFLVHKLIQHKSGLTGTITIAAYRTVYGVKMPAKLLIGYAGLPMVVSADLLSSERGVTLASDLFTLPASARDYKFLTAEAKGPATLAFTDEDNEVIIPVVINGQTRHFLLDSGAGTSFITGSAARALGLKTVGSLTALGYGGSAKTGLTAATPMELPGAVRLNGLPLHVIDDPAVTQALASKVHVDGALGYDIFERFVVQIDYVHKMLTLTAPEDYTAAPIVPGKSVTLPLKMEIRTPTVRTAVDGKGMGQFLIDTGDSGGVHLFTKYAKSQGLLPKRNTPNAMKRTGAGVGGVVQEIVTPGHTLALGAFHLTGVPVATIASAGITALSTQAGGIGNLALRKFTVTMDYFRGQIRLDAPEGFTSAVTEAVTPINFFVGDAAPAFTLKELLQKHLTALGGAQAVNAIQNTRVVGTVTTGGIKGSIVSVYAAPDKEYEDNKLGIVEQIQGYDGKKGWMQDANGNVRPLGSDELKNLRNQLYFDSNAYVLPGRIKGTLTLRPQPEAKTGNYVIDALPDGGKPTTIYLDPKSYLIVKEQHLDDNLLVTTFYSGYQAVNGVQFPTRQLTTNGNAHYDITLTTDKIENNITVADALFQPPTLSKKYTFVTPGASSATVPFEIDHNEISLSATINGEPVRIFFDSGAGGLALSQTLAQDLKLPTAGFLEARGYGGSTDLHPVKIHSFVVPGAVQLTDMVAVAIPLPATLSQSVSKPVAGFVGYDLLSHFVIRINYPKRTITFTDAEAFRPDSSDGNPVPIELDNDVPTLTAHLDNLPPSRFLVDTGDTAPLRLYGPYVEKNGLLKKYPNGIPSNGAGIGGLSKSLMNRVQLFSVAGVSFRNLPTEFSLDTKGGASQLYAGALGEGVLSHFVVTFDYPHSRIFFAPAR